MFRVRATWRWRNWKTRSRRMPDEKELKAACERLREFLANPGSIILPLGLSGEIIDAVEVVTGAAEQSAAENDEKPATVEWLESLSRDGGDMGFMAVRLCEDGIHL